MKTPTKPGFYWARIREEEYFQPVHVITLDMRNLFVEEFGYMSPRKLNEIAEWGEEIIKE